MKFFIFLILILAFGGLVSSAGFEVLTDAEKIALFDIFIEIPTGYRVLTPDDKILFTLKLVNLGGAGRIDVFLEYSIINSYGEIVLDKRETVAIETQASFLREFDLEGVPTGDYTLYAKLIYADGKTADSRHSFSIERLTFEEMFLFGLIIGGVLTVVLLIVLYPRIKLIRDKMKIKAQVKSIVHASKIKQSLS